MRDLLHLDLYKSSNGGHRFSVGQNAIHSYLTQIIELLNKINLSLVVVNNGFINSTKSIIFLKLTHSACFHSLWPFSRFENIYEYSRYCRCYAHYIFYKMCSTCNTWYYLITDTWFLTKTQKNLFVFLMPH
jgi:hypothetical protein